MARTTKNSLVRAAAPSMSMTTVDEATASTAILEFQSPTLTLISAPAPFSARMTMWLISSLVIVSFVLFAVVPIDRVVTTTGVVLAQNPDVIVQPLETAIVRKIYVRDGQRVKKGELLAELDPTFSSSDAQSTTAQKASLVAQVNRLSAELGDKAYLSDGSQYGQLEELAYIQRHQQFVFTLEDYNQKINSLQAKIDLAKGDMEGYGRRLVGLKSIEDMRRDLERMQVGSRLNTLGAIDQRLQIEQSMEDAKHAHDGAQKDLASMTAERDSWRHQWYADTQTLEATQERTLSDMNAQATKNTLRRDLVSMRAEVDSIVLAVSRVAPGTVLQSGTQLMTTVPIDAPLEVVALIDGSDAGFVGVGDAVAIKFDTLPYFRYGYATGHVSKLSDDSFTDPTLGQSNAQSTQPTISTQAPQNTGTAPIYYYRAVITIDKMDLRHQPESFHLMPGMPLEADIRVGERTILQYMFDKIVPFLVQGMREPT
jgi:hemolysin D